MRTDVLVIGLGEIGGPLAEVLGRTYDLVTADLVPSTVERAHIVHVCYPYEIDDFAGTTVAYAKRYEPELIVIHSTVVPGTTREIQKHAHASVVYSPVRGKHDHMVADLLRYSKFVASFRPEALETVKLHFEGAGIAVSTMEAPEALEVAKLLETAYFGVLLGWAQEMERLTTAVGADYYEVQRFMEEIDFLPRVLFQPGFIGGHCVIPNSHLLDGVFPSLFVEAMRQSNEMKRREWEEQGRSLHERVSPREP